MSFNVFCARANKRNVISVLMKDMSSVEPVVYPSGYQTMSVKRNGKHCPLVFHLLTYI